MQLIRLLLVSTVLLVLYMCILAAVYVHNGWPPLVILVFLLVMRAKGAPSHFGTARMCTLEDVPHMMTGNGVIIGKIQMRQNLMAALKRPE